MKRTLLVTALLLVNGLGWWHVWRVTRLAPLPPPSWLLLFDNGDGEFHHDHMTCFEKPDAAGVSHEIPCEKIFH